jgi:hypothetical protein
MQEDGTVQASEETNDSAAASNETNNQQPNENAATENTEDISYHTVEKEGNVTAIWEMQGRKHIRTIDPRSNEGKHILELFETAA